MKTQGEVEAAIRKAAGSLRQQSDQLLSLARKHLDDMIVRRKMFHVEIKRIGDPDSTKARLVKDRAA